MRWIQELVAQLSIPFEVEESAAFYNEFKIDILFTFFVGMLNIDFSLPTFIVELYTVRHNNIIIFLYQVLLSILILNVYFQLITSLLYNICLQETQLLWIFLRL